MLHQAINLPLKNYKANSNGNNSKTRIKLQAKINMSIKYH